MSLIKALIPSTILTLIVSALVGTTGGALQLQSTTIGSHSFYWSWPFFTIVMAINCLLIVRMSKTVNG